MNNWIEIWCDDYTSLIDCAIRNMQSDLECGYDPNGFSIWQSKSAIAELRERYENGLNRIAEMEEKAAQRWCYYDLKKRGAI